MDILNIVIGAWTDSFSNPCIASPTSQLILQPFHHFAYITAHSTALPLLHLRHRHFTYVTALSPTLLFMPLWRCLIYPWWFCNLQWLRPAQLILQPFRCFTYVIGTSPTSQLILQPFCRFTYISSFLPLVHLRRRHFTYVTAHSPTLLPLHLRHSSFSNLSVASPTL